jgi:ankyrin repeat protein
MPLCHAVISGNVEVARLLVKGLGADVNKEVPIESDGATPMTFAAMKGDVVMAHYLVKELGADVNQATQSGATPLHMAAEKGFMSMVRVLKKLGADVNRATLGGRSPLLVAAAHGHADVVKCLTGEFGADINQANGDGVTPLMAASVGKHDRVIRWLTNHGAHQQVVHHRHGTAVDVSRTFGAPAEQTAYLEAKAHYSNPGCDGAGLRKCQGCKGVRYCGVECGLAH